MASPIVFGQGLAGTGVDTATLYPDYFSVNVIWVNSAGGSNANAGTEPELPLATLAQAVTNATAGACIAIAATHAETVASTITVNKSGLTFVGFGVGNARPTLTPASGATVVFNLTTANNVTFQNIYFKAAVATSGAAGRIASANTGTKILNCQFDCGANDQEAVILTADHARLDSCTFTAVGSRPTRALGMANNNTNVEVNNCTFDGASFGWAGNAVTCNGVTNMILRNITLAGNSDINGTGTVSYQLYGIQCSGASRVTLT